jgi:hypothetical protein
MFINRFCQGYFSWLLQLGIAGRPTPGLWPRKLKSLGAFTVIFHRSNLTFAPDEFNNLTCENTSSPDKGLVFAAPGALSSGRIGNPVKIGNVPNAVSQAPAPLSGVAAIVPALSRVRRSGEFALPF